MQNNRDNHWEEVKDSYKKLHDEAYFAGFHQGRYKERDMLVNCGWLQINPDKKEEIQKALEDPCKYCENYKKEYKIGCINDPKKCERKQLQFKAIEVMTHFK